MPGPAPLKLSVLVGTYNRLPQLRVCLDSLVGKIACPHEIVVVDAGSTDGTIEFLRANRAIVPVLDGARLGQARSLNRAIRPLTSTNVCWVSDDNEILPGMLDTGVGILDARPDIGMVGLKVKDVDGTHAHAPYIGGIWETGILTCNQGLFRRDVFARLGGFDEEYPNYGIDADLTARFLLEKCAVALTKRVAIHHHREHGKFPGTMAVAERGGKMDAARGIYARKFSGRLEVGGFLGRVRASVARRLTGIARALSNRRRDLDSRNGYTPRDYYNVSLGRYIARNDLVENDGRDYYLVQKMAH